MIFWFFFLVWKTFLFKFGLLGKLMKKEFPILLVVPINFIIFLAETAIRAVIFTLITLFRLANLLLTMKSLSISAGTMKFYSGSDISVLIL